MDFIEQELELINLTPHDIVLVDENNDPIITIQPSGKLARVSTSTEMVGVIRVKGKRIRVTESEFGEVTGLPDPTPGVAYVVSLAVINALKKKRITRTDLFIPNESVRNDKGQVVGCKSVGIA